MRILLATDAFPPTCGGSGWSTYELARGMRQRGHDITIVLPIEGDAPAAAYDDFEVIPFQAPAPRIPFVRNYFRNERLYPRLAAFLQDLIRRHGIDLVHAQHVLTGPAAGAAARAAGVPSICTVRDYWPVCYWGDLILNSGPDAVCPGCSPTRMIQCIRPHAGRAWPLAASGIPYMRANLRLKQRALLEADVIVAVSRSVAADLRARAQHFESARIETIPNAVDVPAIRALTSRSAPPMAGPYALFVGKLSRHKGADILIDLIRRQRLHVPLVVLGDGPDRAALAEAAAQSGCDLHLPGWIDRDTVFRWLRHARVLIFPSTWPEPLSRVLIEASALGTPIAAMNTGGTTDVVVDEETGLLSRSADELASDVERILEEDALRERLGAAAHARALQCFDVPVVMQQMEQLYQEMASVSRFGKDS